MNRQCFCVVGIVTVCLEYGKGVFGSVEDNEKRGKGDGGDDRFGSGRKWTNRYLSELT